MQTRVVAVCGTSMWYVVCGMWYAVCGDVSTPTLAGAPLYAYATNALALGGAPTFHDRGIGNHALGNSVRMAHVLGDLSR
jgi:hypothetical protein